MDREQATNIHDGAAAARPGRHWRARLELAFRSGGNGRTELAHAGHEGPLRIQRLFYPDNDGAAHCYLLHPPGGVVLGDRLDIDVTTESGRALVTTPSAGRFYGVGNYQTSRQQQHVSLRVGADARLEWLPQETILFSGSRARLACRIELAQAAQLAYWEVTVLGRPASGETFRDGDLRQELTICREGELCLQERLALRAGDRLCRGRIGLNGRSTFGTAVFTAQWERDASESWLDSVGGDFALTQRGEFLIARYLGDDALACRQGFSALWRQVYRQPDGVEASEPRIWHT